MTRHISENVDQIFETLSSNFLTVLDLFPPMISIITFTCAHASFFYRPPSIAAILFRLAFTRVTRLFLQDEVNENESHKAKRKKTLALRNW